MTSRWKGVFVVPMSGGEDHLEPPALRRPAGVTAAQSIEPRLVVWQGEGGP